MRLDKKALIDQLAAQIKTSIEVAIRSSEDAREAARTLQTESEKKEDGRATLEFGTLATAQDRRSREAMEALRTLATLWNAGLPDYARSSAVGIGAIVDVAVESTRGPEERTYFVLPVGAGAELTGPNGDGFLSVITPASPVGRALMGRRTGDTVDVTTGRESREWTVVEIG